MFNVLEVSKTLIESSGSSLSNLHINKILYFFYGVYLIITEKQKLMESPQAWMYGPVFPTVYHRYKRYSIYKVPLNELTDIKNENNAEYKSILDIVYKKFQGMTGADLIRLTHKPQGAWITSYIKGRKVTIKDSLIKKEFENYLS